MQQGCFPPVRTGGEGFAVCDAGELRRRGPTRVSPVSHGKADRKAEGKAPPSTALRFFILQR